MTIAERALRLRRKRSGAGKSSAVKAEPKKNGPLVEAIRGASRDLVRELGFLKNHNSQLQITHSQGHALLEIERCDCLTTVELAQILNLDKSTACRVLAQLEAGGLIEAETGKKEGSAAEDRRRRPLALTAKGRGKVEQINRLVNSEVAAALSGVPAEITARMIEGIEAYAKALRRRRLGGQVEYRRVRRGDNPRLAWIIREAFAEHGMNGAGYSVNDAEVDAIYENYSGHTAAYFVAVLNGEVLGGGGIGPLAGGPKSVCELRKVYLKPKARGLQIGARLIGECLKAAREAGYSQCYIETKERLEAAGRLFCGFGFEKIKRQLGDTGHTAADCYYLLELASGGSGAKERPA